MPLTGFMGAHPEGHRAEAAIIGAPFDGTASYRAGARFGPDAIREASFSLETYSAFLDRDLTGRDYVDWGNLEIAPGRVEIMLELVANQVQRALALNLRPIILGGEHTITLGVIRVLAKRYPGLHILQLDAHADFREEYLGEKFSHATVMRRVAEIIGADRLHRLGIRAGTKEELTEAGIELPLSGEAPTRDIEKVVLGLPEEAPLYITLDLDVFDPALIPGVGNPEPWGITWREFIQLVRAVSFHNIVGVDINELAPQYDPSGVSSVVAASAVRDLMLTMMP
ncbi:MAG: agmatinase [Calditrichota bacterium]